MAKDIGPQDNVVDDEVLSQIERPTVSLPVLPTNELISIGRPLTPISQDASWADRPQPATPSQDSPRTPPPQVTNPVLDDDDDYVALVLCEAYGMQASLLEWELDGPHSCHHQAPDW